ncbi:MAG: hypothetical protein PUH24_08125 [Prevotellaceae bacterium]|nr:hypothetical protein [Prevotellaceae bacterium]
MFRQILQKDIFKRGRISASLPEPAKHRAGNQRLHSMHLFRKRQKSGGGQPTEHRLCPNGLSSAFQPMICSISPEHPLPCNALFPAIHPMIR